MKIEHPGNIEDYMKQFDFHIHSFSRCVFNKRNNPADNANLTGWSLDRKVGYLQYSLATICDRAKAKELKVMGIVEHPQFKRYEMPFKRYKGCFDKVKKNVKDMNVLNGLELSLKPTKEGGFSLDVEEINDGEQSYRDILNQMDYVIGAVHYGDFEKDDKRFKKSFHINTVKKVIIDLSKLRKSLSRQGIKNKVFILGHPLAFMGDVNERDFQGKDYTSFGDYLKSEDIAIGFLTQKQKEEIVELLYKNKIYPEFNSYCIQKRHSDIRYNEPYPKTLLDVYIQKGLEQGRIPYIIPSSDAHKFEEVGVLRADTVARRVPNLDKADVPHMHFLSR